MSTLLYPYGEVAVKG